MTRYLESYSQYDDEDPPGNLPVRWHEDTYSAYLRYEDYWTGGEDDDYPVLPETRPVIMYSLYYDRQAKCWKCDCPSWKGTGKCFHTYRFRGETVVIVNERYL